MSQVRFAQHQDIPALVELGRKIHAQSRYAWMPFNSKKLWANLESAINNKQCCLIVATLDATSATSSNGEQEPQNYNLRPIIGVLWAYTLSLPFCNEFVAQIDNLYVIPQYRGSPVTMKMLAGLRRWGNNRQVAEIIIPNTFGIDQAYSSKLLGKLGLKPVGGMHSMWVDRQ